MLEVTVNILVADVEVRWSLYNFKKNYVH